MCFHWCFSALPVAAIEPVPESSVSTVEERTMEERERWWKKGLKAIYEGKLAVLLLSGGQVVVVIIIITIMIIAFSTFSGMFSCSIHCVDLVLVVFNFFFFYSR